MLVCVEGLPAVRRYGDPSAARRPQCATTSRTSKQHSACAVLCLGVSRCGEPSLAGGSYVVVDRACFGSRLPVPALEETMLRFLKSAAPLLSAAEYQRTALSVAEFVQPGGLGRTLHQRLVDRGAERKNAYVVCDGFSKPCPAWTRFTHRLRFTPFSDRVLDYAVCRRVH